MVEFAMVVAAFVLVTFAAVAAAFHSIQRAMAETAAAAGVQVAAGGTPGDPGTPFFAGAYDPTENLLKSVMFGTRIVRMPPGNNCSSVPTNVNGQIAICVYADGGLVAETIRGQPSFPIPWIVDHLPWTIDVTVEMHAVSYQA
jgi:hypothetical protein